VAFLTSSGGYKHKQVLETWDKVTEWAANNKLVNSDYFGICYGNQLITQEEKCRYDAAITVSNGTFIAAPFKEETIPAGKYAMAYYRGPEDPDVKLHMALYSEWLPQSGFEPDDFPLMERYLNSSLDDGYVEMQILIKLKG